MEELAQEAKDQAVIALKTALKAETIAREALEKGGKGPKGDPGERGPKGDKGDPGKDGRDGKDCEGSGDSVEILTPEGEGLRSSISTKEVKVYSLSVDDNIYPKNMNSKITANEVAIGGLVTWSTTAEIRLDGVIGNVATLDGTVVGIQGEITTIQGQLRAHDTRITANRNHIVEFEDEVKAGNYQAILRSSDGSIEINKPEADHRILNLKVARREHEKKLIIVSKGETINIDKQEDNDQVVFDLDVNLLKVVPGVTSRDGSLTVRVLENEGHDYDLHVVDNLTLTSPNQSLKIKRASNNPDEEVYSHWELVLNNEWIRLLAIDTGGFLMHGKVTENRGVEFNTRLDWSRAPITLSSRDNSVIINSTKTARGLNFDFKVSNPDRTGRKLESIGRTIEVREIAERVNLDVADNYLDLNLLIISDVNNLIFTKSRTGLAITYTLRKTGWWLEEAEWKELNDRVKHQQTLLEAQDNTIKALKQQIVGLVNELDNLKARQGGKIL